MAITDKQREEIECYICQFMDILDSTKSNSEFLQTKWARMSNVQFETWLKKDYPLQFHYRAWVTEPSFDDYKKAAKFLGVSLLEPVALPYLYINKDGVPINTEPALKMRLHLKKVQQFITKKNKISIDIDNRNFKTGRLNTDDKGAAMSDKEAECLAIVGLDNTLREFSTIRADAMDAKSMAYNTIATTGTLSNTDYYVTKQDSLARNLISAYLLAGHISTNLVDENGYTPYTLKERERATQRIS